MDLPKEALLEIYWRMLLARRVDERAWELFRQEKIAYHMSGIGHEAAQVGAAYAIERGLDWVVPYYRDLALMFAMGLTPREFMLGLFAREGDPASGGRQMPNLWSLERANVVSISSSLGSQTAHAVGLGLAIRAMGEERVVLACSGEGATATGEWYEAVNWAAVQRLPIVFIVENNLYAISLRQEKQMAVDGAASKARGLGLPGHAVDGTDFLAVYRIVKEAVEKARAGDGPTLVETRLYRITPHSTDDDDRTYRPREEVETGRKRDPLLLARTYLESENVLAPRTNTRMELKASEIVEEAVQYAESAPEPPPESAAGRVYAEPEAGNA